MKSLKQRVADKLAIVAVNALTDRLSDDDIFNHADKIIIMVRKDMKKEQELKQAEEDFHGG